MTSIKRTKAEAILDIRYQIRLHFLHQRLYRRLRVVASAGSLIAGSGAIASALQSIPNGVLACGIIVAITSAADIVSDWSGRAAQHEICRRQMAELLSRSGNMTLEQIDAELARHEGACNDEMESLRIPAMNDNLRANGLETAVRPEGFLNRLFRLVA